MSGRSGYPHSASLPIGARLFWGSPTARPLLELGGAACDALEARGLLLPYVTAHVDGVTRLDLAADITCDDTPAEFVAAGYSTRYAASGRAVSPTGSTEYIGSPTSDRRCRVYRYAPPHPRADALRVEVVLRRELAKDAAKALAISSLSDVYRTAARPFDFRSAKWKAFKTVDRLARSTLPNEPTAAGRLRWLETQIRPAVLSAHKAGLIDLQEWLDSAE